MCAFIVADFLGHERDLSAKENLRKIDHNRGDLRCHLERPRQHSICTSLPLEKYSASADPLMALRSLGRRTTV